MDLKQNSFFGLASPLWDPLFAITPQQHERRYMTMTPAVDIVEEDKAWLFRMDLPGVEKDNIDIEVNGDQLMVAGQRHENSEEKHEGYTYIERVEGQFRRAFTLPESASRDDISAKIRNGVVEIRVEKIPEVQSRKILIEEQQ